MIMTPRQRRDRQSSQRIHPSERPELDQKRARSQKIKTLADKEWILRPGAKLEKPNPKDDGTKLVISKAPEYILDANGDVVGVDAWVQLFDSRGRELPIDPHRRIINPPTVPRANIRWEGEGEDRQRIVVPDPLAAFWEAVWDSVESTPNAKGWRTRGTVTTVFSGTNDGFVIGESATYSTARSTGTTVSTAGSSVLAGQFFSSNYSIYEGFLSFDTSAIDDADTVSAVELGLWLVLDLSTTDFTLEARESDWGASVTTGDYIAGASLGGLTLLASIASSGIGATGAYKTLTSEAAFLTATNLKTGTVYVLLSSSRQRLNNAPTGEERLSFSSADEAGTTQDPKLTITHAAAAVEAPPPFYSRPNRIWRLG